MRLPYKFNRRGHTYSIPFCSSINWGFFGTTIAKRGSEEYKNSFKKVEKVFKHQTVFNLKSQSATPLEECEADLTDEVQYLCGKYP